MSGPLVGVLRQSLVFTDDPDADGWDDDTGELVGNLFVTPPDGEPFVGTVVLYTLDQQRLLGMLAAARAGEDDASLMLSLEAAALGEADDEDDAL